jgi:processive rubber oxygenase RoxA-like protein
MSEKIRRSVAGRWIVAIALVIATAAAWVASGQTEEDGGGRNPLAPFVNPTGVARTFSASGHADTDNPFFQSLGTNGRACITCHQPATGWTISPAEARQRFERTGGLDPIFRTNDGSNSPLADVSTVEARRNAYSMLLNKGLIRVGIGIPAGAEFTLEEADDPYGFASASELSLFRRPLPSTNLAFLSGVMWDGRETFPGQSIAFDLMDQANGATLGHAQASRPLTAEEREQIVAFETALYTAQIYDVAAGDLSAKRARGGPRTLSGQEFYIGINDPLGANPRGIPFTPVVFTDFEAWMDMTGHGDDGDEGEGGRNEARMAIARGEQLFNSKPIDIRGVKGLNDDLGLSSIPGTCGTCHDSPNIGNHSVPAPLDIGLTDPARRTPDLPLYTLRKTATGDVIRTTDPGRALVTGRWKDIGRFKGPILRGLAARAPYFHNGSAATLTEVVEFYNSRFNIGFTEAEIADLVAFLRAQ